MAQQDQIDFSPIDLDSIEHNQTALNSLRRAVVLGQGEFSLILAQANYRHLRQVVLAQLSQELDLNIVSLPPNATSLREAVSAEMDANAAKQSRWNKTAGNKALMIVGIEEMEIPFFSTGQSFERAFEPPYNSPSSRIAGDGSNLVKLLKAANLSRDELPKRFPYPVVLWVNDTVLEKMNRYAPDLKSFAATPIRFDYSLSSLSAILSAQADDTFRQILDGEMFSLLPSQLPGQLPRYLPLNARVSEPAAARELRFAIARITQIPEGEEQLVNLDLLADLLFLQGRSLHRCGELPQAKNHYKKSLLHWQQKSVADLVIADLAIQQTADILTEQIAEETNGKAVGEKSDQTVDETDRAAVLMFHLGLWWRWWAVSNMQSDTQKDTVVVLNSTLKGNSQTASYQKARQYFEAALKIFQRRNRSDRVGRFISPLAEVLKQLKEWDELSAIAHKAIPLHQKDPIKLAEDYGYLAEAILARNNNHPTPTDIGFAQRFVLKSLEVSQPSSLVSGSSITHQASQYQAVIRYQRGGYFYLLARTHQLSGQSAIAIEHLKRAQQNTSPYYDLTLYRQILDRLWMLYFKHKQYAEAFEVKLEQRRIESLFGLRAFIGAGQIQPPPTIAAAPLNTQTDIALSAAIKASGRAEDITALVERLAQPRYPIVVIHGQSGVGKSSILRAGLIPQLRSLMREGRTTLPILIGGYSSWAQQIEETLLERGSLESEFLFSEADTANEQTKKPVSRLSRALQQFVLDRYQQVVLIFDQFEDFFYNYPTVSERMELYTFLRECLDLPYVKVVLSLREDFLHYLLEWDRSADLETINNDILSKDIRYYLGNFTPKAAERLIHRLSEPSAFSPEPALVSALISDLAALTGEVRPIELQVVGAQLQRQKIETLAAYRALGQSPKKRLLKNFLNNVIYDCGPENRTVANSVLYLLSEGDNRPLKSLSELREPLTLAGIDNTPQQLSLVLDIFIGSGLVFEVPEVSGVRYQLVHEYLASLVQDQQQPGLMEVLRVERDRRALTEDQLQKALAAQSETLAEATLARQKAKLAEIEALISDSRSLRLSGHGLEALAKALQAASQVQAQIQSQSPTQSSAQFQTQRISLIKMQATLCLATAIYGIHERNILIGHRDWVLAVDWSASPPYNLVSASEDGTLKLWTQQGQLIRTLAGHEAGVIDVCFSQDGRYIVSAGLDHTVRLWQSNGELIQIIESIQASVTSVCFNPDATVIAATYSDTITRLWNLDGELIATLEGHEDWARAVQFSPDGQMLATGGEDKTVRLWSLTGELLQTLRRHRGWVRSVSFSPDGAMIAAAGDTNGIRLWGVDGRKLKTFYGHENWVRAVAFSPDGRRLVSASDDQTIRIWGLDGEVLAVFEHRSNVHSVAWSADGRSLVSGGDDDQVRIWQLQGPASTVLEGHGEREHLENGIVWGARWRPG